jgi:cytochrome c biogenesis protein
VMLCFCAHHRYFYLTLAWLAASLMACTSTRQWPAVKVSQRWRFQSTPSSVVKQGADGKGVAEVLPNARLGDLGMQLMTRGYQVRAGARD